MFAVIYIPSNLVTFLVYLLTWSYNVYYEGDLLYYYFFSGHICQALHDNMKKLIY